MTLQAVLDRTAVKSKSTIYRWMDEGVFPQSINIGSRCVRWRSDDFQRWEESQSLSDLNPSKESLEWWRNYLSKHPENPEAIN